MHAIAYIAILSIDDDECVCTIDHREVGDAFRIGVFGGNIRPYYTP
jgi:hypothetical protein